MHFLRHTEITISPNRQRQDFNPDSIVELMNSITTVGLLQPLVVRQEGSAWVLVAGERRLRALNNLWELGETIFFAGDRIDSGLVPVVSLGELLAIDAFEAELDENIKRADLTWQEKAQAISALHTLRQMRAKEQGLEHRISDTAREVFPDATADMEGGLGHYHDTVRKSLIIAKHLGDAEVGKAKNLKDAFKILERKEEARTNAALAASVGTTFGGHSHTLLQGDCLTWMQSFPDGGFDVICTDPPYGMDAQAFGDGAGRLTAIGHAYDDSPDSFRSLLTACAREFSRIAKPAAHLYLCCDFDQFPWLRELFTLAGWSVFRTPLINVKVGSGRVPLPEHGPRRTYETILYAYRGGKRCTAIYPDVISTEGDENLGHGAQKPVALFVDLLRRSCRPGDSVLDPFCGTGTIFPAAHSLKVAATGIEAEAAYYGVAVKRIESL